MSSTSISVGAVNLLLVYADPGSGMLLWQLITAAALGLMFYARTIIRKIRTLIGSGEEENRTNANRD